MQKQCRFQFIKSLNHHMFGYQGLIAKKLLLTKRAEEKAKRCLAAGLNLVTIYGPILPKIFIYKTFPRHRGSVGWFSVSTHPNSSWDLNMWFVW